MNETNTTTPAEAVSNNWPGAFALYNISKPAILKNLAPLAWIIVVTIIVETIINGATMHAKPLGSLLDVILSVFLVPAEVMIWLGGARGRRVEFLDALSKGSAYAWKYFLLQLLVGLTVIGGLILLIVPGIIFGLRLSLAQFYLVDQNMSVMEAYKASWHATKGHLGKMWGIIGVSLLMALPVLTIIGVILSAYWLFLYSAATPLLYLFISKKIKDESGIPGAPAPAV